MKDKLKKLGILLIWIAVWALIALIVSNPIILAAPLDVIKYFVQSCSNLVFWLTVAGSLLRVFAGFVVAFVAAFVLALFSFRFKIVYDFLQPLVQFIKSAPIVCIIVLALMWFGVYYVDVFAVCLAVLPIVYYATYQALDNKDTLKENMLKVHRVKQSVIFAVFEIPSVLPYIKQAIQSGIGVAWKSGVTAQMIGAVGLTIGQKVYDAKLNLDSAGLFCWMFVVIILSFLCEKLLLLLVHIISKRVNKMSLKKIKNNLVLQNNESQICLDSRQNESLVSLKNICKSYGDKQVLSNYSLCIMPGQKVLFNQPSGYGKTTIINLILGLEKPDKGVVRATKNVSVCFQTCTLLSNLRIKDNIQIVSGQRIQNTTFVDGLPDELSGGMKRLAEIERALTCRSDLVILDEPFAGLDTETKSKAQKFIDDNLRGRALLLVSHV